MLYGCKQDPDDFAAGTQMNRLADQHGFIVLYPAQSRTVNGFGCWNWFNRHDQERDAGEPSLIAGMIDEVAARHPVDRRRIYAAGLSAGGAMTTILAHTYPELLAGAGVHSGLAYAVAQDMITALGVMKRGPGKRAAPAPVKPTVKPSAKADVAKAVVPMIVFHGDHDKTVHPLNGEHVVEQALESVRAARPHDHGHPTVKSGRVRGGHAYTRTLHTDRAGHVQVEHWVVEGSGHAWSGGDAQGSFTDPLGPDASAEMLRFFLERSKA
jgi:poly(hydroxyalkanoate) depolymerase family esterase